MTSQALDHGRRHPDLLRPRHEGQHRQDRRLRARGRRAGRAGHPAVRAVPGHLFLRRPGAERGSRRPIPWREHPCVARAATLAAEARRRHPDLVLREGRAALLTTAWRWSTPTAKSSASIARATFPTGRAIRRSTTSGPATPASRSGTTRFGRIGVGICWDQWYPECARAMVLHGRRGAVLPDRHRLRAARRDARHARAMAARHAGPCGLQRRADRCRQPHWP